MNQELFCQIFDNEIYPFVKEIDENNAFVSLQNLDKRKTDIFRSYQKLNQQYKQNIFEKGESTPLLDRHKIAACICGAFLCNPIFDKTRMLVEMKTSKAKYPYYFYYVNEMVTFHAAVKFLSFFMVCDYEDDKALIKKIISGFPEIPHTTKNKKGFWSTLLFNLSQINDQEQIGNDHFDVYAYAMIFFFLENHIDVSQMVQKVNQV